jgi:hypothetical protein
VAEGTALLKLHRGNSIGGSNPPLSAIPSKALLTSHLQFHTVAQSIPSQNTSQNTDADVAPAPVASSQMSSVPNRSEKPPTKILFFKGSYSLLPSFRCS